MIEVVRIKWSKCGHVGHVPAEMWGKVNYRCSKCRGGVDSAIEVRRMIAQCSECKSSDLTLIQEPKEDYWRCEACKKSVNAEPRTPDFRTEVEI